MVVVRVVLKDASQVVVMVACLVDVMVAWKELVMVVSMADWMDACWVVVMVVDLVVVKVE